jgi:uncharacterized coiled-coil protein SlyX
MPEITLDLLAEQLGEIQAELSPLHDRVRYIAAAVERLDNSFYARPDPRWWEMGKEDPPAHWRVALKWARFLWSEGCRTCGYPIGLRVAT